MKRLLAAAALLLAACSGDPILTGTQDVTVQPDRAVYDRGNDGSVQVRFMVANYTAEVISIPTCGGPLAELQRWDGRWRTELPAVCIAIYGPLELASGATVEGVTLVAGPGTYRLRLSYGAPGYQVVRHGVSPSFRVR
jgi:hypothetical protein